MGVDVVMRKLILYWRILFLTTLVGLLLANIIELPIFIAVILGITFFQGIPWLYGKMNK